MNIVLKCHCGSVAGYMQNKNGLHIVCMCDDCQAFAHYLKRPNEILDQYGGTEIYQTAPSGVKIHKGQHLIKAIRLSDKGMIRWYADCCKTPVGNTMPTAKMPFVGLIHTFIDSDKKTLGPVVAMLQGKYGIGKLPPEAHMTFPLSMLPKMLGLLGVTWILKKQQPATVFFSADGQPTVNPTVLSESERSHLREFCGPK